MEIGRKTLKKRNSEIYTKLKEQHPDAKPELVYANRFELLIAVILSAQCTDVRVNKATAVLFREAPTPQALAEMPTERVEDIVRTCGMYKNKSRFIKETARMISEKHGGVVPSEYEALVAFPGVSRKTANVVRSVGFGIPAIAVDTHVYRVSKRIGLSSGKTVEEVEEDLMREFDRTRWNHLHHLLIFHGRYVCKARNPVCEICLISSHCRARKSGNYEYR